MITKQTLIESLQQFYKEHSRSPTTADCANSPILKGKSTYTRYFGSFTKALEAAGLPTNKKSSHKWNKDTLISSLKRYYEEFGEAPSQSACTKVSYLASHTTYCRHFSTFAKAVEAAGLEHHSNNHITNAYTEEELLDSLKRFFNEFGRPPKASDFKKVDYLKSSTTYHNKFGGLKHALQLAEIPALSSKEQAVEALKRFYEEYNRPPTQEECKIVDYLPSWGSFYYNFNSFSEALEEADIPQPSQSSLELELFEYIESIYSGPIKQNTRPLKSKQEIDIILPELNLGFEFNGLYWHSEDKISDKNYHLQKTIDAKELGINLIHIFEHQWINKQDIVKSRISNLLKVNTIKLHARKCKIKELANVTQFLNDNHIQGAAAATIKLGLIYEDELVAVMTFSKPRYNSKYEYELIRFCNKKFTTIPGAASKLLSYFEKTRKPKSIISYADRCWSNGSLYERLNFELSHHTKPNYWYFKKKYEVESRVKYQKHKLATLLPIYNSKLSEVENMKANGYKRYFDCGNLVFIKILNQKS